MKLRKPHCNFCDRDLQTVRVDGSATGEGELADIVFEVTIDRSGAHCSPSTLSVEKFRTTSNPIRYSALVETWVEEVAEEVRCPLCTKTVKLVRIVPPPPQATNTAQAIPLQHILNQFGPMPAQPFSMSGNGTFGQNQAAVIAMLDSKFTDQELIDLLTDLDQMPPGSPPSRGDLMDALTNFLYT